MKLTNEHDAIRQAGEAGYESEDKWLSGVHSHAILLDPAFWQALGKARGWRGFPVDDKTYVYEPHIHHALRYFETRLSNGDLEAFWQSLP